MNKYNDILFAVLFLVCILFAVSISSIRSVTARVDRIEMRQDARCVPTQAPIYNDKKFLR